VHREGKRVTLEPADEWSEAFLASLGRWKEPIERTQAGARFSICGWRLWASSTCCGVSERSLVGRGQKEEENPEEGSQQVDQIRGAGHGA
jgi:hypothetical protein